MAKKVFIKWEAESLRTTPINWSSNPYQWQDVSITEEVLAGGSAEDLVSGYEKLDKKKKKRFIELICIVKNKTIKERKEMKNIKVILGIDLEITMEKK